MLQVFPDALDDVNVILPPAQKVVGPLAATVGVTGTGLTVIVVEPLAEVHPLPFVTFTVYVPPALTVIDCVVAPVLQVFPEALEDVSVTVFPAQKVNGPLADKTGVLGNGLTITAVFVEVALQPAEPTVTE